MLVLNFIPKLVHVEQNRDCHVVIVTHVPRETMPTMQKAGLHKQSRFQLTLTRSNRFYGANRQRVVTLTWTVRVPSLTGVASAALDIFAIANIGTGRGWS